MGHLPRDAVEGQAFSGREKVVTEDRVLAFSGGFPRDPGWPKKTIHTSLDFATSCGLPSRVASGAMFEGYLAELMTELFGESWLRYGAMDLVFVAIVSPGDTLTPKARVKSRQVDGDSIRFAMEIWCENQRGDKVVVGTAAGFVQ